MAELDQLLDEIAAHSGCVLPAKYIERISALKQSVLLSHPALPNRSWRLLVPKDLLAHVRVDNHSGVEWQVVSLFGRMLSAMHIARLNGRDLLSIKFLESTVSIAQDNGDYLFIRPDSSVWIFYHDGHEVQEVSNSFDAFDKDVIWPKALNLSGHALNEWETQLVGRWRPVSSDTETDTELFDLIKHDLIFDGDRSAKLVFSDGTSEEHWFANSKQLTFTLQGDEIPHHYRLTGKTLDVTAVKFGDHTRYERAT